MRTDGEDELVVESCGYDPQEDSQTQRRSPKRNVMLVPKQELGRIPVVLESAFLIHPNRDCESAFVISFSNFSRFVSFPRMHLPSLHQKPPNTANTSDKDVPREETYDGAEAQLAENEKDNTSEEGGERERDERRGNDRLGVVFPNNSGDIDCENIEERLPGRRPSSVIFYKIGSEGTGSRTTYHYFYHHPADSACETATAKCEH